MSLFNSSCPHIKCSRVRRFPACGIVLPRVLETHFAKNKIVFLRASTSVVAATEVVSKQYRPINSYVASSGSINRHRTDFLLQDQIVYSKFSWPADLGGSEIFIWGSFNDWAKGVKLHKADNSSDATVIMPLQPGNYEFKFVVDGTWTPAPHEPTVTNSEGHLNNFRVVASTASFRFHSKIAESVMVIGSWDNWRYSLPLARDSTGHFTAQAHLPPGQYSFVFVVDGQVAADGHLPLYAHPDMGEVHRVWSFEPTVFRIYYCTGWEEPVLHYRRLKNGVPMAEEWQTAAMVRTPSRPNALGSWRIAAVVPANLKPSTAGEPLRAPVDNDNEHSNIGGNGAPPGGSREKGGAAAIEEESLEFYLSNGLTGATLKEDRPGGNSRPAPGGGGSGGGGGRTYLAPLPGSFKLSRGLLRPFCRGAESRIMLVSDIDGTMVGEMGATDPFESSRRFVDYWENSAALAGSLLVYNTGRSLGQFVELISRSGGALAVPDVLVTAVGTKIWHLAEPGGRAGASGLRWAEDLSWAAQLDEGWDLAIVRRAVRKLLDEHRDASALCLLDDGSEHQHRVAVCAAAVTVDKVLTRLRDELSREGLRFRLIVSGSGSHRYVDCVAAAAGKERALQHVRRHFGIPGHLCAAAGDSGNDIAMLAGAHPAIVVGNAQPELLTWLAKQPQDGKVLLADAHYADGILEGLARHSLY